MREPNGSTQQARLRVATWNIKSCRRGLDRVASLIRSLDLDLIALQEVDRRTVRAGPVDQPAELARLAGFPHQRFFRAVDWLPGDYGLALLSRWPLSGERVGLLPNREGVEPRIHASAIASSPLGDVAVHVTHLCHWPAGRALRAKQALRIVDRVSDRALPHLLMGDFNDGPDSPVHKVFADALTDVFDACGEGGPETFPMWPLADRRIDFVFASPELSPLRSRVVRTNASDHWLLWAELGLKAQASLRWASGW